MRTIANVISTIFHPLYMPVLGMGFYLKFVFFRKLDPALFQYVMIVMVACTMIFPLMAIFLMKTSKAITSVHMPTKEERRWPLLLGTFFFFLAYLLIKFASERAIHSDQLNYITIAGIAAIMMCTIINLFYKLSIHMAAIAGLLGLVVAFAPYSQINPLYLIIGLVMASGLVGFARLQLNAHSSGQLVTGFLVGFLSQFLILKFFIISLF